MEVEIIIRIATFKRNDFSFLLFACPKSKAKKAPKNPNSSLCLSHEACAAPAAQLVFRTFFGEPTHDNFSCLALLTVGKNSSVVWFWYVYFIQSLLIGDQRFLILKIVVDTECSVYRDVFSLMLDLESMPCLAIPMKIPAFAINSQPLKL